ncbi:MAG: hypothetical protein HKO53_05975 [Gemmatimonadetes bacterium]|nr:hypothetical protein [Gemmatimonadota bacterium]
MRRGLIRTAAWILGSLASLMVLFVVVGLALPHTVEVTRSVTLDASPAEVFPHLDDLEAWTAWTPWGDVESHIEGNSRGTGAARVWDDPNLGSGTLTITNVAPLRSVDYRAEVEGGLTFLGTLSVRPEGPGTSLVWTESVSWGMNPLMGWTGLTLGNAQGRQLEGSLDRLRRLVAGSNGPNPPGR